MKREENQRLLRQRRQLLTAAGILAVVLCVMLVVLLLPGGPQDPTLNDGPTQSSAPTQTTGGAAEPSQTRPTEPESTQTEQPEPTEPTLVYPPDATPEQMLEAFMDFYDLTADDYPPVVLEAFAHSRENINYLLTFPMESKKEHQVDLSGYDLTGRVPLFIQWDLMWGYETYAGNYAGLSACGPVCTSMVACYLTGDAKYDPVFMMRYAEDNGYCADRQGTYWSFFTQGMVKLGFMVKELYLTESKLISTLNEGKLIICSMGPGYFTSAGHFIVITGYEDGYFTVNDPNSYLNSQRKWAYDEFSDQIKNLWSIGL